jgi:hypothetical protein
MREIKLRRTHRRVRRLDGLGLRDIQGETAPSSGYPSRECLKALVFTGNSSHGKALPFGKERNYFIYNKRGFLPCELRWFYLCKMLSEPSQGNKPKQNIQFH